MAASIFAAQLAQSRSMSLKVFFMIMHPFIVKVLKILPFFFIKKKGSEKRNF